MVIVHVLALTAGKTHALQNLIYMASRGPLSDICLVSFSVLPKENDILFSLEKKFGKHEQKKFNHAIIVSLYILL